MHQLVASHDGVRRADLDAQGAANAPVFINEDDAARPLGPVHRIQCGNRLAGEGGQPLNPLGAARRALVDARLGLGDRLRIGGAVGVAATGALCLRQGREHPFGPFGHYFLRAGFFAAGLATGLAVAVAAGFVTGAAAIVAGWCA